MAVSACLPDFYRPGRRSPLPRRLPQGLTRQGDVVMMQPIPDGTSEAGALRRRPAQQAQVSVRRRP